MLFNKSISVNGITCTHHMLTKIQGGNDDASLDVWVSSWPDEASRLAGNDPAGRSFVNVPLTGWKNVVATALTASGLFAGAVATSDSSTDITTVKARKVAELVSACQTQELSTFTANAVVFPCDASTRRQYLEAARHAGTAASYTRSFKSSDGVWRSLSKAQVLGLADALDDFTAGLYTNLQSKLSAVAAALTAADVAAIVWP